MRKWILYLLTILMLSSSVHATAEQTEIQVMPLVFISDGYFERFIREYLNKPIGAITLGDMEAMKEISELTLTGEASYLDCSILPFFENLTSLTIETPYRAMFDLSPIKELSGLTRLVLHTPHAVGFSALGELSNLTYLDLSGCYDIADISFLRNLTELVYLDLNTNNISNLSTLSKLTKLEYLNLNAVFDKGFSHSIEDISVLRNMVNLKELHLYGNRIADLSPLKNLASLEVLDLGNNNIKNLSALSGLTQLTTLNLGNHFPEQTQRDWWGQVKNRNRVNDLSPLSGLVNLAELNLRNCEVIEDLSPLADLESLSILNLENCEIVGGLSPLAGIKNLTLYPEDWVIPGSDAYTIGNIVITSIMAVNLRAEDKTDSEAIGKAQPGDILKCVGITDSGWYMVDLPDGQIAFVSNMMAEISEMPITD